MSASTEASPNTWQCPVANCGYGIFGLNSAPDDDGYDEDPIEEHLRNAHPDVDLARTVTVDGDVRTTVYEAPADDEAPSGPLVSDAEMLMNYKRSEFLKSREVMRSVVELVEAVLTERGFPSHPLAYPTDRLHPSAEIWDSSGMRPTFLGSDLLQLAGDLLARFRNRNAENPTWGDAVPTEVRFLSLNGDGDVHSQRFILADVGQGVGARVWPVTVPHDVIAFGCAELRPASYGVRFMSEAIRVYCDAVRLVRDDVGLLADLVRTLRLLYGALSDQVGRLSVPSGSDSTDEPRNAGDEPASGDQVRPHDAVAAHDSPPVGVVDDPSVGDHPAGGAPIPHLPGTTQDGATS